MVALQVKWAEWWSISTWEHFEVKLRQQFYPEYAEEEARTKLDRVEHKGGIQEDLKSF